MSDELISGELSRGRETVEMASNTGVGSNGVVGSGGNGMSSGVTTNLPKLNGTNYQSWKEMIQIHLKLRGLLKAVTEGAQDETCDLQAKLVLLETMDESHRGQVRGCERAIDIMKRLDLIYADKSAANVYRMISDYFNFKKDPKDSVSVHIGKMDDLRNALFDVGEKQTDRIHQVTLIGSLPIEYSGVLELWELTAEEMRTNQNLVSRLLKKEKDLERTNNAEFGLAVSGQFRRQGGQLARAGFKPPLSAEEKKRMYANMRCYSCGKLGHPARDCTERSQETTYGRNAHLAQESGDHWSAIALNFNLNMSHLETLKNEWAADSGATSHYCNNESWFTDIERFDIPKKCRIGDGNLMDLVAKGSVPILARVGGIESKGILKDVYLAPQMPINLFSVGAAAENGIDTVFTREGCTMSCGGRVVAEGLKEDEKLYKLKIEAASKSAKPCALLANKPQTLEEYHKIFGHYGLDRIKTLLEDLGVGIPKSSPSGCVVCPEGSGVRASHPSLGKRADEPGCIHIDLSGPVNKQSSTGQKYYMLCKDELTSYMLVYFCKDKTTVAVAISKMLRDFEAASGRPVYEVVSDNGSEFVNSIVDLLLAKNNIKHRLTTPYTPQQNGRIEREMRTITEKARTMLLGAPQGLPIDVWPEAIETAVYIQNRLPTKGGVKTPYEMLLNRKPYIAHMVEFGTPVHTIVNDHYLTKWDPRTKPGYIVGYTDRRNTYKVYLRETGKVIRSCDIIFRGHKTDTNEKQEEETINEEATPLQMNEGTVNSSDGQVLEMRSPTLRSVGSSSWHSAGSCGTSTTDGLMVRGARLQRFFDEFLEEQKLKNIEEQDCQDIGTDPQDQKMANGNQDDTGSRPEGDTASYPHPPELTEHPSVNEQESEFDLGRAGETNPPQLEERPATRIDETPPIPPPRIGSLLMVSICPEEPNTYEEALTGPNSSKWRSAIKEELQAHMENGTWLVVDRPSCGTTLTARWVFVIKRDREGNIERFKARLVARGFQQREGVDYFDVYAPVAGVESVRTMLALAAVKGLNIFQFDVTTAFLHGEIEEQVYLEPPQGIRLPPNTCLKLTKALYGLKQAPKAWHQKLDTVLRELGMVPTESDPCVYVNRESETYILIYVDDGLVLGRDKHECEQILVKLKEKFRLKLLKGEIFIGIEISRAGKDILLSQQRYTDEIITRFGLEEAKATSSPFIDLRDFEQLCETTSTKAPYRQAVGSLLYLANCTRPDILFAVNLMARFNQDPKEGHWKAVKQIMRYLKQTKHLCIRYNQREELIAYCDSDWASPISGRYSTSGVLVYFGGGPVLFSSRKQTALALSSTEAEYISACEAAKTIFWFDTLLKELGYAHHKPLLRIDNRSALKQIENAGSKRRSKHVDIAYHYVRHQFREGLFGLEYIPSSIQPADILTKPLSGLHIKNLISSTGLLFDRKEENPEIDQK